MSGVLETLDKYSPALSGVGAVVGIAGAVYGIVEGRKQETETKAFRAALLGGINRVSSQLEDVKGKLDAIRKALQTIDDTIKEGQVNRPISRIDSAWERIPQLDPSSPTYDQQAARLAAEIMGRDGTLDDMNLLYRTFTSTVFRDRELVKTLEPAAFMWVRTNFMIGLNILAFGCAYHGMRYGVVLRQWSQKLYEYTNLYLQTYFPAKYKRPSTFKSTWDNKPGDRRVYVLDSMAVIDGLGQRIAVALRASEELGGLSVPGYLYAPASGDHIYSPYALGFEVASGGKFIHIVLDGQKGSATQVDEPPTTGWSIEVSGGRKALRLTNHGPLDDVGRSFLERNIVLELRPKGNQIPLGCPYGQLAAIPADGKAVFCIWDQKAEGFLTRHPEDLQRLEIRKLSALDSLRPAQWTFTNRLSAGNYLISPIGHGGTAKGMDRISLGIDKGGWKSILSKVGNPDFLTIARAWAPQRMDNPFRMKPRNLTLTDKQTGHSRDCVLIPSPFTPVASSRLGTSEASG